MKIGPPEQREYTAMIKQAQLSVSDAGAETVESIIELATNAESLWKQVTTEERRKLLDIATIESSFGWGNRTI